MRTISCSLVAAAFLFPGLFAAADEILDCTSLQEYWISTQDDLLSQSNGSATVCGSLFLNRNFSGPLDLKGIKSINGSINSKFSLSDIDVPGITSLVLDDLVSVEQILFENAPLLASVSAPKLEMATDLTFSGFPSTTTLNFPSLRNLTSLNVYNNVKSLNFPLLLNVSEELVIQTYSLLFPGGPYPPMDVSLPSLEFADSLQLDGSFSTISMPLLRTVGTEHTYSGNTQMSFNRMSFTTPVNLTFPSLTNLTQGIQLNGNVSSLSLDSLIGAYVMLLTITSKPPLNFTLPALQNSSAINLNGDIYVFDIPNLRYGNTQISLETSQNINCGEIEEEFSNRTARVLCFSQRKKGLSNAAKIKLGTGLGIPLFVIGIVLFFVIYKKISKKRRAKKEANKGIKYAPIAMRQGAAAKTVASSESGLGHELSVRHSAEEGHHLGQDVGQNVGDDHAHDQRSV